MLTHNAAPEREDALAEINAIFEKSDLPGQVLWHPTIPGSEARPDAVVFIEETMRAALVVVPGTCSVNGSNWRVHDSTGGVKTPNPLERAWRAAEAVRIRLKNALGIGAYTHAVVIFPHMQEDAAIIAACRRRKVRLLWGLDDDLVDTLAALPEPEELQTQLSAQFIEDEIAVLQDDGAGDQEAAREPSNPPVAPDAGDVDLAGRGVYMQHVDQVVINIHLPNGAAPP